MRIRLVAAALALTACAHGPATPPAPRNAAMTKAPAPAAPRRLDQETTLTTRSGASFRGAPGWTVTEGDDGIVLRAPEGDLTLTFGDFAEADADRALERAWKAHAPSFALPVKRRVTPPARDGWEAITQLEYETPAAEKRLVIAIARRFSGRTHVTLVDGTEAAVDRRGAQMMTAVGSYKPKGLDEETLAERPAHDLDEQRISELSAFAEQARELSGIPGAAVAVVQHGKVVLARGFGVREKGKPAPVGTKTLFMIGSTTKSLTTMMMAKLVDEGAFRWDTPVREVEPTFAIGDEKATREITMRHTVCACTGLPRQDLAFIFEYRGITPEMRVASLAKMKPTTGFGETFQYSNVLVAAGGFLAAHAAAPKEKLGPAYDAVFRSRVLRPLGMNASTFDMDAVRRADHASPHGRDETFAAQVDSLVTEEGVVPIRPAGALWSNAEDMARVLLVETGKGMLQGKRLFSEENLLARRKPQTKITDRLSYGLGLFIGDDHGLKVVEHGGNNLGFTSDMFFLPDHDLGMVVLTNLGSANSYRGALRRKLLEIVFDAKPEAEQTLNHRLAEGKKQIVDDVALVGKTPSKELLSAVTGTWTNPDLGRVEIRPTKDGAVFDAGEWKSAFGEKTEKDGAKKLFLLDPPFVGFELDVVQSEQGPTLGLGGGQERHVFTRLP